jgi:hypothetical protein
MRKFLYVFCVITLIIFILAPGTIEAKKFKTHYYPSIAKEEFVLGGIKIDDNIDIVKKVYGEPSRTYNEYMPSEDSYFTIYCYGDSLKVYAYNAMNFPHKVFRVITTANNGIVAPSGIPVGETCEAVLAYYGYDNVAEFVNNYTSISDINGQYHVRHEQETVLVYTIKNGKIAEICLSQYVG